MSYRICLLGLFILSGMRSSPASAWSLSVIIERLVRFRESPLFHNFNEKDP